MHHFADWPTLATTTHLEHLESVNMIAGEIRIWFEGSIWPVHPDEGSQEIEPGEVHRIENATAREAVYVSILRRVGS